MFTLQFYPFSPCAANQAARTSRTTKLTRRRKRRRRELATRAEAVGGRVQRLVLSLVNRFGYDAALLLIVGEID